MEPNKPATKVLIVDDNKSIRTVLCVMLRSEGYDVVGEMSTGENFLENVERLKPDIICLDQDLPGCNGLDLMDELNKKKTKVVVVMITGTADPAVQNSAIEHGVAGFLKKPFNETQVINELKQVDHARMLLSKTDNSPSSEATGVNVVIADDSLIMRQVLALILKSMGLNVVGEARNGKEAISLVAELKPQALCLDINMPMVDGLDALREIKAAHPNTQVIIVSAHSERDKVKSAIELGACGYIVKPYESKQVINTIRKLLFG